jgi:hypothetical protein
VKTSVEAREARALLAGPPCPLIALRIEGGEFDIDFPADATGIE